MEDIIKASETPRGPKGAMPLTANAARLCDEHTQRLPNGTDALPLLRHIILHDDKFCTYKLGLLRALCRAADGSAGLADEADRKAVAIPLGLIALNWLRLYLPLLKAHLPQSPTNLEGGQRLAFAKKGFDDLMRSGLTGLDLNVGRKFGPKRSCIVHAALRDAVYTIVKMSAGHITDADGKPILPVDRKVPSAPKAAITLNSEYLSSFGSIQVQANLWCALQRYAVWIEPALIEEWKRLIRHYAKKSKKPDEECMIEAMVWADPKYNCSESHKIACDLMLRQKINCVWSGRALKPETLDIDHCLPWAAWPCGDFWNLLPAHKDVNRKQKRSKLPSKDVLCRARDGIIKWWKVAYCDNQHAARTLRFEQEARASLPGIKGSGKTLDLHDLFAALESQRDRLHEDQQVPEWAGT